MKDGPDNSQSDISCINVQESVLAHLDGEHDEAAWDRVKKHLLSCEKCAGFAENSKVLNKRLQEELKDDVDLAALWSRISAGLDAESETGPVSRKFTSYFTQTSRLMLGFGAIAAAMLVAVFTFSPVHNTNHNTPISVTESINDFLTFRASGRELDVSSNEPLELRRWFVKRLDFEVPLSSSMPAGFKLSGARLCSFLNRRLAAFMYHMGDKAASVYVMTETGLDATLKRIPKNHEMTVFSSRGLTNVVWRSNGLLYVVVADFPKTEAIEFASSVGKATRIPPSKVTVLKGGVSRQNRRLLTAITGKAVESG